MKNFLPIVLVILAMSFFSSSFAQEVKEVKEARVKIVKNVNGETIVVDTIIQGGQGEINAILKDLNVDEEVDIEMDVDIDVDQETKHGKAKFITINVDSDEIEVDGDKEIMVTVQAAIDEAMDAISDEKGDIKMIMKTIDSEDMIWHTENGDSIKFIINAEMDKHGHEMEDIHVIMSDFDDINENVFFSGDDFKFDIKTSKTFIMLSDLNEEQWKYFGERGYKHCRNTFTPMDITVNVKPNKDALKLAFTVTPDDEYDVLLLNEDFTPILQETFTMSAGAYERSVDIPGDHSTFYLQIVKGKSCYTKVVDL